MDTTAETAEKLAEDKLFASRKFRYRLYPSKPQAELLLQMMETHRRVWNELLGVVMDALRTDVPPKMSKEQVTARAKETGESEKDVAMAEGLRWRKDVIAALKARGWTDAGLREALRTRLREMRKTNPFAGKVSVAVLDAVVIHLVRSWGAYRAAVRGAKMPRFKKRGEFAGIAAPARNNFWLEGDKVEISSVELDGKRCPLRFVKHREMPSIPKSAIVVKEGSAWFVAFSVEVPIAAPGAHKGPAVGIDRGVRSAIADSTGRTVGGFEEDPTRERKKRRLERSVSRKILGSSNWRKAQAKLLKHMQKTTRRRDDFLHKESLRYAKQYGTVVVERLAIANMTRSAKGTVEEPGKNVSAKAGLNRAILQQGWGRFAQYLKYKLEERGGTLLDVDPKNTSRTCAACGVIDAESRDGKDFECTACGHRDDADVNAARVILALGMRGEVALSKKPRKKLHSVVGKKNKTRTKAAAGEVAKQPVEDKRESVPTKQEAAKAAFGSQTSSTARDRASSTGSALNSHSGRTGREAACGGQAQSGPMKQEAAKAASLTNAVAHRAVTIRHSVVGKKNKTRTKAAAGRVAKQPAEDKRNGAPMKQEAAKAVTQITYGVWHAAVTSERLFLAWSSLFTAANCRDSVQLTAAGRAAKQPVEDKRESAPAKQEICAQAAEAALKLRSRTGISDNITTTRASASA